MAMAPSRHELLDHALAMSRRMADLGEAGEWEAVIELEPQRRSLLEQAFATHAPVDELIADRVKAILDLDRRLMSQSVAARDRVAAEITRAAKGRKATTAYQQASG
jgi:hypothetical protein